MMNLPRKTPAIKYRVRLRTCWYQRNGFRKCYDFGVLDKLRKAMLVIRMCRLAMSSTSLSVRLHNIKLTWGTRGREFCLQLYLYIYFYWNGFLFFLGIRYSDINTVPGDLRGVLERCLSEDPSPDVLDTFMPEVRHVLFDLLRGLKKQQESWQMAIRRRPF